MDAHSFTQIGDTGLLELIIEHTGSEPISDATVGAARTNDVMTIDGAVSGVAFVGDWEPGEQRAVTFDLGFEQDVTPRAFGITVDVRYEGVSGDRIRSDPITASVIPSAEQTFEFTDIESSLRVADSSGWIQGSITNTGDLPVRDLRISLPQPPAPVTEMSGSAFVGSLDAGETARFSMRGNVSPRVDPGLQQIDFTARYRTVSESFQESRHVMAITIADRRDAVSISAPVSGFESGYSGVLHLNVTNAVSEELRDIELRLVVEEPIESDFRTTMVPVLAPGEMEQVAFDIDVDSDAPQSRFPVGIDVVYSNADGDRISMRSAWVTLSVEDTEPDLLQAELLVFIVLALLVVGVFVWLYRR